MTEFHSNETPCYRCGANGWGIIETREVRDRGRVVREDVVECVFCGVLEAFPAVERSPRQDPSSEFRFQYGRFAGMTLAEADAQPNGRRYLEHMRDTNEKLRGTIEDYLSIAAPSA